MEGVLSTVEVTLKMLRRINFVAATRYKSSGAGIV